MVLTRIFFTPSSQAILRPICNTADLLVLYDMIRSPFKNQRCYGPPQSRTYSCKSHLIGQMPRNRRDENDTSWVSKTDHLLTSGLCCIEDPVYIHIMDLDIVINICWPSVANALITYLFELLCRIIQAICVPIRYPSSRNTYVHPSLTIPNILHLAPHSFLVSNITTNIFQS
jgi:hypothetical protein